MKSIEKSLSEELQLRILDENIAPVALVPPRSPTFQSSGGGSMVNAYAAPLMVSWSKGRDVVDSEWVIALGVAALVAAALGLALALVLSVCNFCGTLGSYWSCYWTMVTWLMGYWC
jgi:hypothetical protein